MINLYGKEYKSGTTLTTEGKPYGSWYGYVADGYFSSREEIDASPVYGGNKANVAPGDIKYKDISGPDGVPDGKIDSHDRTIIGNPTPRYEFGLTLGLQWKGIDFSAFFQGVGKRTYTTPAPAQERCVETTPSTNISLTIGLPKPRRQIPASARGSERDKPQQYDFLFLGKERSILQTQEHRSRLHSAFFYHKGCTHLKAESICERAELVYYKRQLLRRFRPREQRKLGSEPIPSQQDIRVWLKC